MGKFKYNPGDLLGPKKNILFIERLNKINNNWYGKFQCPYCEKEFTAILSSIVSGHTKSCGCYQQKIWNKQNLVGQRFNKLIVLEETERRVDGKIIWKCQCDCGNITYVNTKDLKNNHTKSCGCLQKEYQQRFGQYNEANLLNKKFGLLTVINKTSQRTNAGKILWNCRCECGNLILVSTNHLQSGHTQSCGCSNSKGEHKISNILNNLNITFQQQKTFNNCRNSKTNALLKFDFYLPDYNCCIEYDGEQHFKEKENYYKDTLKERQQRDEIKNQYCQNNNIKLIRIPYWDYNKLDKEYILDKLK